ncbi:MAG TPA: (2Fe-2S)-binding protein [Actinomycetales bacterium]|jgi:bacterioferritin-associated ferredoxin
MIICHCAVVSDRDVVAAVENGARTLSQVCRTTSAAQDCGGCIFAVKATMCRHSTATLSEYSTAPLLEETRAAG